MANSRSARKRIRSSERKHERNRAVKSAVRTKVIKARHALLDEGGAGGDTELHAAIRALDRAAEKGVLHRNNVRRRKSRLASMAARLSTVGEGAEGTAARSAAAGGAKGRSAKQQTRPSTAKATAKPAGKAPAPKASTAKPAAKASTAKVAAKSGPAATPAKSPARAAKTS